MKGRLVVKNGKYYVVISYQDESSKSKQKWVATGLDEKNNKRAAMDMLRTIEAKFANGTLGANSLQSQKSSAREPEQQEDVPRMIVRSFRITSMNGYRSQRRIYR